MATLNTNPDTGLDHDFDNPTFGATYPTDWETLLDDAEAVCGNCGVSGLGVQFGYRWLTDDELQTWDEGCIGAEADAVDTAHDTAMEQTI